MRNVGKSILGDNNHKELIDIITKCYCQEEVLKPTGEVRSGFFNLKRLYGMPDSFKRVIDLISDLIKGDAICAPDIGIAPLVGALAFRNQIASVYVRSVPKYYYLSYGSRKIHNDPELIGEFQKKGTNIQIIDDVIYTGESIINAISILEKNGFIIKSVLCILDIRDDQLSVGKIRKCGINDVTILLKASELLKYLER